MVLTKTNLMRVYGSHQNQLNTINTKKLEFVPVFLFIKFREGD
jgi:hypothetical protein